MKSCGREGFPAKKLEIYFLKLEFFKISKTSEKQAGDFYGVSKAEDVVNLEELWGLLLWVYFIGVPSTMPRSGKPGWPTDGGGGIWPTGRPSCC